MNALIMVDTVDRGVPVWDMRVSVSHWGLVHCGYITDWPRAWPQRTRQAVTHTAAHTPFEPSENP